MTGEPGHDWKQEARKRPAKWSWTEDELAGKAAKPAMESGALRCSGCGAYWPGDGPCARA